MNLRHAIAATATITATLLGTTVNVAAVQTPQPEILNGCRANAGATIVQAYCTSETGEGTYIRAWGNCTDGLRHYGPRVYEPLQVSEARCGIHRVRSYGYSQYWPNGLQGIRVRHTTIGAIDPKPAHAIDHNSTTSRLIPIEHAYTGTTITETVAPQYATNCTGVIRSSRTSAVGNCYNWSGSGSWRYQIAALGIDACGRRMWFYGSVGQVYVPGRNKSGWSSLVYSPGLTWRFYAWKIIVWKP